MGVELFVRKSLMTATLTPSSPAGIATGIHPSAVIHPSALVDATATIGEGTTVGAFSVVGPRCTIGANCEISPHVVLDRDVTVGNGTKIYPTAVLGCDPQDIAYKGETSRVVIGDGCWIREGVTVHRASGEGKETRPGGYAPSAPTGCSGAGFPVRLLEYG